MTTLGTLNPNDTYEMTINSVSGSKDTVTAILNSGSPPVSGFTISGPTAGPNDIYRYSWKVKGVWSGAPGTAIPDLINSAAQGSAVQVAKFTNYGQVQQGPPCPPGTMLNPSWLVEKVIGAAINQPQCIPIPPQKAPQYAQPQGHVTPPGGGGEKIGATQGGGATSSTMWWILGGVAAAAVIGGGIWWYTSTRKEGRRARELGMENPLDELRPPPHMLPPPRFTGHHRARRRMMDRAR